MSSLILYALIIGACSAFLVMTLKRTGVLDYLQNQTPAFLPWACDFCINFWICLLTIAILTATSGPPMSLQRFTLAVLIATTFGRNLTK